MKNFTIHDLEHYSGIKAHTLRIWESRYSITKPGRSPGNNRLYTLDDLRKILNIVLLKNSGHRISVLSKVGIEEIENKIEKVALDFIQWQKAINDLTINMHSLQSDEFEKILDKLLLKWPIDTLIENIIFPFLTTTGLLWKGHRLSEEHFVVTAIRKKIILGIESIRAMLPKNDDTVLLFLPDSKQLDLGLLYSNYYLKRNGVKILYMGNDVTLQNLVVVFQMLPISTLFTYLPKNYSFPIDDLLHCMKQYVPHCKMIIGKYSDEAKNIDNKNVLQMNFKEALNYISTCPYKVA